MVVIDELAEVVRNKLYNEWNLHGELDKTRIDFNTGVTASSRKYPSIEIAPGPEPWQALTMEWHNIQPLVIIHIWVRPKQTSTKSLGTAKSDRKYIRREIERIIHKYQTQFTDQQWVRIENSLNADQYHGVEFGEEGTEPAGRGFFPILHTLCYVRGWQWHSATLGGVHVIDP